LPNIPKEALTSCQNAAITKFQGFFSNPNEKYFLLTGAGGTGKTSSVDHMVESIGLLNDTNSLMDNPDEITNVVYASPTHKAAGVLADMINEEVFTIHSLFSLRQGYDRDTGDKFFYKNKNKDVQFTKNTLIVIDEVSMISETLFSLMEKNLLPGCMIVFLGNHHQIPPVGYASSPVFKMGLPHAQLNTPVRFNNPELIALNSEMCLAIDENRMPKLKQGKNIKYVGRDEFERLLILANQQGIECKAISWTNNKVKYYSKKVHETLFGTKVYNIGQKLLAKKRILAGSTVIHTQTVMEITEEPFDTELFVEKESITFINIPTDKGTLTIPRNRAKAMRAIKPLKASKQWSAYNKWLDKFAEVISPYSITTHMAQGSTYPTVFIDLPDIMKNKNFSEMIRILYTASSRASEELIFLR